MDSKVLFQKAKTIHEIENEIFGPISERSINDHGTCDTVKQWKDVQDGTGQRQQHTNTIITSRAM